LKPHTIVPAGQSFLMVDFIGISLTVYNMKSDRILLKKFQIPIGKKLQENRLRPIADV